MTSSTPGAPLSPFELLDRRLGEAGCACELCPVGDAVVPLVFAADPPTRSVRAMFRSRTDFDSAVAAVVEAFGLDSDWLGPAVRRSIGPGGLGGLELDNVRVVAAPPAYVLAMKCAALNASAEDADRADIRLLLRRLVLTTPDAALEVVGAYFPPRQLPDHVREVLADVLSPGGPNGSRAG